ncbi:NAD(P)H-dependent oxidoreductase [Candidatus Micrarchaeota archaeon]|nr:NAD(P)H-dependent oxidoreductase [Candidatus Micrarchaeota archaeon]
MKTLVVFYSRTGTTKKVAKMLSVLLKADLEEIIDTKNRNGFINYLISTIDAIQKKYTKIKKTEKDPADYDLVVIGTPVWFYNLPPAVRTYLFENQMRFSKTAFFCTQRSAGAEDILKEMEELCEETPQASMVLTKREVMKKEYSKKLKEFVGALKKPEQK